MNEAILIGGMFLVTFSVRYVLFAMAGKVHFPAWLSTALGFVPPTVLTAIIVPAVLIPQGDLWISPLNPWLLASSIAALVSFLTKNLLATIVVGMIAFAVLRFGLGF